MEIFNKNDIKSLNCDELAPIMIGGPKRSGTTLLRKILGSHSLVTCTPPDFLFNFVYYHLYSYGNLSQTDNLVKLIDDCLKSPIVKNYFDIGLTPAEIIPILPERSFRGVYMTLNYLYMNDSPTPYLVCKTPCNIFWFKEIHGMFPNARFIFLYRDGRDASIDQVDLDWGANNIYSASLEWQCYIRAMLESKKYLPKDSCYEIHYENMVQQPDQEISKICTFLDLDYELEMLRWYEKSGDRFSSAKAYHQITNSPITDEFVGMYKSLPEEDRKLFATVIGDTLREVNYRVEDEPREIGFWEREWYLEEERYAALIPEGASEYKYRTRNEREERRKNNVWSYTERNEQFGIPKN